MQQLTGLCSSDCRQWAIPRRQRNPVAQENGQEMLARTRGHLPTPQRKSPESLEILGALFVWWSRGDLNPKLQYPGQIKPSAHCARNFDLLDCSQ